MLPFVVIAIVALLASFATFFSGFGLGTVLLPAFAIFFPIETAVLATAIVHFANNIFKFTLVFNNLDRNLLLRFAVTAGIGSLLGAYLLEFLGKGGVVYSVQFGDSIFPVNWSSLVIGILMLLFAILDLLPLLDKLSVPEKWLPLGGLISGFFGGLSGHQGALRAAFLSRVSIEKAVFVSTSVAIAMVIDTVRISIYSMTKSFEDLPIPLLLTGIVFAFSGSFFGKRIFDKTENLNIRRLVAVFLFVMGMATILGLT